MKSALQRTAASRPLPMDHARTIILMVLCRSRFNESSWLTMS